MGKAGTSHGLATVGVHPPWAKTYGKSGYGLCFDTVYSLTERPAMTVNESWVHCTCVAVLEESSIHLPGRAEGGYELNTTFEESIPVGMVWRIKNEDGSLPWMATKETTEYIRCTHERIVEPAED